MTTDSDDIEPFHATGNGAPVTLGIRKDSDTGEHQAFLCIGDTGVQFDADTADALAADLRRIAVELRNGGRLS